jgi:hypothetical protein
MKREIVPVLAKSLGQPTEEEIKLVLGELKKVKQKIGWKLKASDLVEGMQTAPL